VRRSAREQYPPRVIAPPRRNEEQEHPLAAFDNSQLFPLVSELARTEQAEMDRLLDPHNRLKQRDPLAGVLQEPTLG
jgi:hypothetical protein